MDKELIKNIQEGNYDAVLASLQSETAERIDHAAAEIMSYTDGLKCEYHLLKGRICEQLKGGGFENMVRSVKAMTKPYVDDGYDVLGDSLEGDVEIGSETVEDALVVVKEEMEKLIGMKDVLHGFAEHASEFCSIFLKNIFGEDNDASVLPEPLIGRRDEDGSWNTTVCRNRFINIMLFLLDEYDVKSVPFRAAGSPESDIIEQSDLVDGTVNRKAMINLLQSLYAIDEATLERLQNDNAYFVEVAKYFLDETAKTITKAPREVFLAAHGIEDGVPQTLMELSDRYGVTREHVRQLLEREARKLKQPLHRERILRLK